MRRLVAMAPPAGSFGMQTSELFLPGSLSLGQKSSEALCPTPTLQPWALRTSLSLVRTWLKLTRAASFSPPLWSLGLLLVTHPTSMLAPFSPALDSARMDGFGQASGALISRAESSQGGSILDLLGRAIVGLL